MSEFGANDPGISPRSTPPSVAARAGRPGTVTVSMLPSRTVIFTGVPGCVPSARRMVSAREYVRVALPVALTMRALASPPPGAPRRAGPGFSDTRTTRPSADPRASHSGGRRRTAPAAAAGADLREPESQVRAGGQRRAGAQVQRDRLVGARRGRRRRQCGGRADADAGSRSATAPSARRGGGTCRTCRQGNQTSGPSCVGLQATVTGALISADTPRWRAYTVIVCRPRSRPGAHQRAGYPLILLH